MLNEHTERVRPFTDTVNFEIALTSTHRDSLSRPHREGLSADHLLSTPHLVEDDDDEDDDEFICPM